jgi:hypothetical protein
VSTAAAWSKVRDFDGRPSCPFGISMYPGAVRSHTDR